jgi:hypothetical protein
LTIEQLAQRLLRHPKTIRKYVKSGKLKEHRLGCMAFFIWEEVSADIVSGALASCALAERTRHLPRSRR